MNSISAAADSLSIVSLPIRYRRTLLILLSPALLTTIALWLCFGFSLGGLVEEWGLVSLFSQQGIVGNVTQAPRENVPDEAATPPPALTDTNVVPMPIMDKSTERAPASRRRMSTK
jgi:hypothetical protein